MDDNRAEMLVDGHRLLPRLLEDIAAAERAIHISMFLFFRDPIGEEIAAALMARAAEGVAVRVLINMQKTAMGDPFSTCEKEMMDQDPNYEHNPLIVAPLCDQMRAAGVDVIDTNIDYDREVTVRDVRLRSVAAQVREGIDVDELHIDHRKIVAIDGRVGYCGGANFGAQYLNHIPYDPAVRDRDEGEHRKKLGLPEPWWKWHDSLTRFEGPVVEALDAHFRERWILDGGDEFEPIAPTASARPPRGIPVERAVVVASGPCASNNEIRELYVGLIQRAERSIFIENPYLYHPSIVEALCAAKAARPALEVVLIVPSRDLNDNMLAQDAMEHYYARFLECGIEVHAYQNHFNHIKVAVFDERWSIHGSTNLNHRSLENDKDFELVVLVDGEALARAIIEEVRNTDLRYSRRIVAQDVEGSLDALRVRMRNPMTLLMLSRRVL